MNNYKSKAGGSTDSLLIDKSTTHKGLERGIATTAAKATTSNIVSADRIQ
jgi:hypothetical protein